MKLVSPSNNRFLIQIKYKFPSCNIVDQYITLNLFSKLDNAIWFNDNPSDQVSSQIEFKEI